MIGKQLLFRYKYRERQVSGVRTHLWGAGTTQWDVYGPVIWTMVSNGLLIVSQTFLLSPSTSTSGEYHNQVLLSRLCSWLPQPSNSCRISVWFAISYQLRCIKGKCCIERKEIGLLTVWEKGKSFLYFKKIVLCLECLNVRLLHIICHPARWRLSCVSCCTCRTGWWWGWVRCSGSRTRWVETDLGMEVRPVSGCCQFVAVGVLSSGSTDRDW